MPAWSWHLTHHVPFIWSVHSCADAEADSGAVPGDRVVNLGAGGGLRLDHRWTRLIGSIRRGGSEIAMLALTRRGAAPNVAAGAPVAVAVGE